MGGSTTTEQQGSSVRSTRSRNGCRTPASRITVWPNRSLRQPLQQYQGQMVADVSPQTQQAWNLAANSGNVGQDAQNAAQAGYLNTMARRRRTCGRASVATQICSRT